MKGEIFAHNTIVRMVKHGYCTIQDFIDAVNKLKGADPSAIKLKYPEEKED